MRFYTLTNEVHLLENSTSIDNANAFQVKVIDVNTGNDITTDDDVQYYSNDDSIATINNTIQAANKGYIEALTPGKVFITVTYKESNHIHILVTVHNDIKKDGNGKYMVISGDDSITTYMSDSDLSVYYIPCVYAIFDDGNGGETFGDISMHPYLLYQETDSAGANVSTNKIVFDPNLNYRFKSISSAERDFSELHKIAY